ncbi:hypothetical protein P7H06_17835 [Paenibacillus larvae]|nr:hypothetical protein [Paenibacillus larvae]MDT2260994.1 hypothetical protein [Paenibacillus larvae]
MDEVDRLLWESESLQGYVLLDEYDAASSEKQLQMRNIWEAVAEETSEAGSTITAEQQLWREKAFSLRRCRNTSATSRRS